MRHRRLHSARTRFHQVRVVEEGDLRVLYFQSNPQTQMASADPDRGGLEYTTYVHLIRALAEQLRHVLVLGLGGGSLPKEFLADYPEVRVDAVEIDPEVVQIARKYFELPTTSRFRVVVADAREFLSRTRRKYDFIMVDAYLSDDRGRLLIPPHLATEEFFRAAAQRLTPTGWLGYNLTATLSGPESEITGALLRTMAEAFPYRGAFDMDEDVNLVLFANRHAPLPAGRALRQRVAELLDSGALKRAGIRDCLKHYHRSQLPKSELVLRDPGDEVPKLMGCTD
jgi:spermidine synthase